MSGTDTALTAGRSSHRDHHRGRGKTGNSTSSRRRRNNNNNKYTDVDVDDDDDSSDDNMNTTSSMDSAASGRRVYCKGKDSSISISKQISMASLPNSIKGFPVRVFARRAEAINVAVKATAIATARLNNSASMNTATTMKGESGGEDPSHPPHTPVTAAATKKMNIVCIPFFRETRNAICLHIVDIDTIKKEAMFTTNTQTFNIGSKTSITTAAGAIANAARDESSIVLTSIGSDATFNSIRSVAVAREYLLGRNDGVDLFTKIEFIKVSLDNNKYDETTAVQITCFLHQGSIILNDDTV